MHDTPAQPEPVPASLSSLTDEARSRVLARFQVIRPFLEDGIPLARVAREQGMILRTARRWVNRYRKEGLIGLARKERGDRDKRKLTPALPQLIEGMALQKPRVPVATIHREVTEAAKKLGQKPPSYKVVHAVIAKLEPALVTLAHEGSKTTTAGPWQAISSRCRPRRRSRRPWRCGRRSGERPKRAGMFAGFRRCSTPIMAAISRRIISSRWRPI